MNCGGFATLSLNLLRVFAPASIHAAPNFISKTAHCPLILDMCFDLVVFISVIITMIQGL